MHSLRRSREKFCPKGPATFHSYLTWSSSAERHFARFPQQNTPAQSLTGTSKRIGGETSLAITTAPEANTWYISGASAVAHSSNREYHFSWLHTYTGSLHKSPLHLVWLCTADKTRYKCQRKRIYNSCPFLSSWNTWIFTSVKAESKCFRTLITLEAVNTRDSFN